MIKFEVKEALRQGRKLINLHEAMFTIAKRLTMAYASKYKNIVVDEFLRNTKGVAVVAAISSLGGLESFLLQPKSINSQSFIRFVELIIEVNQGKKIALFLDNCSAHRSKLVKQFFADNDILSVFNLPYCPQYNPIEVFWSVVKNIYKRRKQEKIREIIQINHDILIRQCLLDVKPTKIRKICEKSQRKHIFFEE